MDYETAMILNDSLEKIKNEINISNRLKAIEIILEHSTGFGKGDDVWDLVYDIACKGKLGDTN